MMGWDIKKVGQLAQNIYIDISFKFDDRWRWIRKSRSLGQIL